MTAGGGEVKEEYGITRTSVWWDIENCQVPKGYDGHVITKNMASALAAVGYKGPLTISVYGDTKKIATAVQHALSGTGITLNHVPFGVKDASDKKILVDMLFWAVDNPPPANYLLISGDRDFSYALHQLRMRRYNILLAHAPNVSQALVAAARTVWLWTSLLAGEAPLEKQRTEQWKKRDAPSFQMDGSARPSKKRRNNSGGSSSGGGGKVKPRCQNCGKRHFGACTQGVCFFCQQEGHIKRECPLLVQGSGAAPHVIVAGGQGVSRRCQNSGKNHFEACRAAQGVCFHCQQEGHFKRDCLLVHGSGAALHVSEAGGQGVLQEQGFSVVDCTELAELGAPVEDPEEVVVLSPSSEDKSSH